VVGVNWNDAEEFCKWLTVLERNAGDLPRNAEYRLPKDEEWSVAVGLKDEVGSTPDEKSGKIWLYPWEISQKRDKSWPPPTGAGNYAGEEAKIENLPSDFQVEVIEGYNDGFPRTSPVGSFQANLFGLYDMGGNVWQWCEDWYNDATQKRVLRGAGWYTSRPVSILASHRAIGFPSVRHDDYGFRCVVAVESSTPMVEENGSRSSEASSPPPQPSPSSPPLQTPTEPVALERVKSKGIADYFRALPPQEFTKSAPSDLLRIIRSGKGKSRLDSRNGFMFLEGEGEQVSLGIALFLDANRLPLLAIAWGKLHQPDFTHLSFFTEKDDRMIPADRTILPVGDSDKLQFELPQIGLTLVVRDASGKVISKWTWNIDRARFELSK
jgi:hypothetical protein